MSEPQERPKKVLIIVENLPVPLDRRVWQEACALRDAGYEVHVICPQMRGFVAPEEVLDGIHIYRHWISGEANGIKGFLYEYTTALWGEWTCALKVWRRHGFDVVHLCNPPDLLFLVALPFKLFAGVKVVYDVHDLWPEMFEAKFGKRGLLYWAVRLAERATLAIADVVIATNESVLAAVRRRSGKKEENLFIVRTAPSSMDTNVAPDPALKNGRQYLIGYIGVMGDADGVGYLVDAANHIVKTRGRHDVQFLLMGSGPEYQDLMEQRDRLGLQDYVSMPGRVTNEFLYQGLKTMDLGVACDPINPYNDHCTMNKTLEYMTFGKAQVMFATHEGQVSAAEAAFYVHENSAEKLGDAILSALAQPEQCEAKGKIGLERMKCELSWKNSVRLLKEAYHKAFESR